MPGVIKFLLCYFRVLKYVTTATSLALDVDRNSPLDKEIQDQEKSMMESMKVRFKSFQY